MKPIVQNVIASSSFPVEFNLFKLSQILDNCKYTPEKFSALFLKIINPKCTVLIFGNGKIVLTGLKTKIECRKTILKLEDLLFDKCGCRVKAKKTKFQNFVVSHSLEHNVNLEKFYDLFKHQCTYTPEIFPGLNLSIDNITVLIFHSGKIVFTGVRKVTEIKKSLSTVKNMIQSSGV
jgi:transcription initiation factor TFIID TATA-box-binding protein